MSMLITINRKTSMHIFAQNNCGIPELFLAFILSYETWKKAEESTDGHQKMANWIACQNQSFCALVYVSWPTAGSANLF